MNTTTVEFEVTYVMHTDSAILVDGGEFEHWLPLSQVEVDGELYKLGRGNTVTIHVAEWLAIKKGMV